MSVSTGPDILAVSQRRFRALLAVLLLNDTVRAHPVGAELTADSQRWVAWWDLGRWDHSDCTFADQSDELVVLCAQPRQLTDAVTPCPDGPRPRGIPGLRRLAAHPRGLWFRFWHPPTQAVLHVRTTKLPLVRPYVANVRVPGPRRSFETAPRVVTDAERRALQVLMRIHPDAQHLLAALLVRLPEGSVRAWYSLWGHGMHWTLRGTCSTAAVRLAQALTDQDTGLHGTSVIGLGEGAIKIGYRDASLQLITSPPLG